MTTIAAVTIANLATFLRPDLAGTSGTYVDTDGETKGWAFVENAPADVAKVFTLDPEDSTPVRLGELLDWVLGYLPNVDEGEDENVRACRFHNLAAWAIHILDTLHGMAIEEDGERFGAAQWQFTLYPAEFPYHVGPWSCAVHNVETGHVLINFRRDTPAEAHHDAMEALVHANEARLLAGPGQKLATRTVVHFDEWYVMEYGMPVDDANLYASAHEENRRTDASAEIVATLWPVPDRSEGSALVDWKCALHKVSDGRLMYVSIGVSPRSAYMLACAQVRTWTPDLAPLLDRTRLRVMAEGYEAPKWLVDGLTAR
jgi:hypothetical protein